MSEQAKHYLILKNDANERCILLTPISPYTTKPSNPEILYDGGEHAILYRTPTDTIILDYYPENEREYLKSAHEILVVEYNTTTNQPTEEYTAKISIVKSIPDITKNLEIINK